MSKRAATPFGEKREPFVYGPWTFISEKSHILNSDETDSLAKQLDIPQLPEMTFGRNKLGIRHSSGFSFDFDAVAGLRLVDNKHDLMKVAVAAEWSESRQNDDFVAETIKPFDWTFTTRYKGSMNDEGDKIKVSKTEEKINIERLKAKEKILFFEHMMLFEDELADNGCAQLSVKMRVMPSCFFILLRFFLRVDGVLSRIFDTRWYHEFGTNHIIREYSEKEKHFSEMRNLPPAALTDDNYMDKILKMKTHITEKIEFQLEPSTGQSSTSQVMAAGSPPPASGMERHVSNTETQQNAS